MLHRNRSVPTRESNSDVHQSSFFVNSCRWNKCKNASNISKYCTPWQSHYNTPAVVQLWAAETLISFLCYFIFPYVPVSESWCWAQGNTWTRPGVQVLFFLAVTVSAGHAQQAALCFSVKTTTKLLRCTHSLRAWSCHRNLLNQMYVWNDSKGPETA